MKNTFFSSVVFFVFVFLTLSCNKTQNLPTHTIPHPSDTSIAALPRPDHIVIVIEENHSYSDIIGSDSASYINALVKDPYVASFTNAYATTHPSQPNYLDLFSGSSQGVKNDNHPANEPFTSDNLAAQLIAAGLSYSTYSESLPYTGFNGDTYNAYARKHNPAANWMGTGPNQIPATTNQPFSTFPTDYTQLPTVSIVVPDLDHDMHDGSINSGDTWLRDNLDKYIQWAKTHNSLFILTFDEDDSDNGNHIVTIFAGSMVKGGEYSTQINHYHVLRTIENMYELPYAGDAANVITINNCWR